MSYFTSIISTGYDYAYTGYVACRDTAVEVYHNPRTELYKLAKQTPVINMVLAGMEYLDTQLIDPVLVYFTNVRRWVGAPIKVTLVAATGYFGTRKLLNVTPSYLLRYCGIMWAGITAQRLLNVSRATRFRIAALTLSAIEVAYYENPSILLYALFGAAGTMATPMLFYRVEQNKLYRQIRHLGIGQTKTTAVIDAYLAGKPLGEAVSQMHGTTAQRLVNHLQQHAQTRLMHTIAGGTLGAITCWYLMPTLSTNWIFVYFADKHAQRELCERYGDTITTLMRNVTDYAYVGEFNCATNPPTLAIHDGNCMAVHDTTFVVDTFSAINTPDSEIISAVFRNFTPVRHDPMLGGSDEMAVVIR